MDEIRGKVIATNAQETRDLIQILVALYKVAFFQTREDFSFNVPDLTKLQVKNVVTDDPETIKSHYPEWQLIETVEYGPEEGVMSLFEKE